MEIPDCSVKLVSEIDKARIQYLTKKYPSLKTTQNYQDLFQKDIHAVVIATSPSTHYSFAKEALENGKHVLIEKPMAMNSAQAEELIALSKKNKCKIMVGHTFEYNAAVQELKKYVQSGEIGHPYYIYSQRLNLGIVRQDVNALWNLAPHDVSILLYLLEKMPVMVSARGYDFLQKGIEDVAFVVLHFPDNTIAHVQVSWLDPSKVRKMTLVGSKKMIIYDDVSDSKIQIYDKGIRKQNITDSLGRYDDFEKFKLIKSAGDVIFPKINFTEPLYTECSHFVKSILEDKEPLTDGKNGLNVVKILEAAQESLKNNGTNIEIN